MKAAICNGYGSPNLITVSDRPTPVPVDNEVLVKIAASTINSADWRIRTLSVPAGYGLPVRLMFGFSKPKNPVFGLELSGEIAATGPQVKSFKIGDQVFAMTGMRFGCHAEYITLPETANIVRKPSNLIHELAAGLSFGGGTALDFLKNRARIQSGEKILINGASGAVGIAAVQLAKHFEAHVTAVTSKQNHDMLKELGADQLIDYREVDFAKTGETWDIIMDNVGNAPLSRVQQSLTEKGRLLILVGGIKQNLLDPIIARLKGTTAIAGTARENIEDLRYIAELAESGEFTPVIDSIYSLDDIREAHERVASGHKAGCVVIRIP